MLTTVAPSLPKFYNGVTMAQTIMLCAGKQYELTFKASCPLRTLLPVRVSLEGSASESIFLGIAAWMPGAEGYRGYGPFPFTAPAAADGGVSVQRDLVFEVETSINAFAQFGSITIDEISVYQP